MDGVIVVDKPEGWTSHDAVARMRRLAGTRKIGHLGTLDPQATGVLPLVIGRATRLAQFYVRNDKVYDALIHFGYSTDSYDKDGAPTSPVTEPQIDHEDLETRPGRLSRLFRSGPAAGLRQEDRGHAGLQTGPQTPAGGPGAGKGGNLFADSPGAFGRQQPGPHQSALLGRDLPAQHRPRPRQNPRLRRVSRGPAPHRIGRFHAGPGSHARPARQHWRRKTAWSRRSFRARNCCPSSPPKWSTATPRRASVRGATSACLRSASAERPSTSRRSPRTASLVAIGEAVLPNLYHPILVL